MLEQLFQAERELPSLLAKSEIWNTLHVFYEKPHVERVWCQWNEYRINLHRISSCEKEEAFFHPHPWSSAMRIISGKYEMEIGFERKRYSLTQPGKVSTEPRIAAHMILHAGSCYEMTNFDAWHYVRPLDGPVMSLMITGKPWGRKMPKSDKVILSSLTDEVRDEIMKFFKKRYA